MGSHHARVLAGLEGCKLVAVCDVVEERAAETAAEHGCDAAADVEEIMGGVDAAVVAVPTAFHRDVAEPLLLSGVDLLIEKPLASTLEHADALIAAAGKDRILAVGHTERFNPAVRSLLRLATRPQFLEVHRLGAFPNRSTDVDAVLDLMIHDLDIILHLVDRPLTSLEAVGVPVLTERVDIANARLAFEGGCVANITASRVSQEMVRKIRLFQMDTYVSVDYAERSGRIVRVDRADQRRPSIESEELAVVEHDPLTAELQDFLEAVRRRHDPAVPAWQGRRALEAALSVRDAIHRSLQQSPAPPNIM